MSSTEDHMPRPLGGVPLNDPAMPRFADLRVRLLRRLLSGMALGHLRVILPTGETLVMSGVEPGPEAVLHLHRWRAVLRLLTRGDLGFGEAFVSGEWSSPDLVALLRLAARNIEALDATIRGSVLMRAVARLRHMARPNSRGGSKRNIIAHYDLGNSFYARWLDDTMLYSAGMWGAGADTLEAAQAAKLTRIAELLDLTNGNTVLEIGCGWGALAAHLAESAGARVTGITLSPSQLQWARRVSEEAGVADKVDLHLRDYRDQTGTFDRIASIEMFEAVGEAWWPTYFQTIAERLKPGGRAVLQVISISEDRYESYRRDTDFIQHHVFPGGFLPSPSAFRAAAAKAGLKVAAEETFGLSYADTLAEWRRRFHAAWPEIARMNEGGRGFDERFRRLWDYYLAYCEAGFREGTIDVGLYTLVNAGQGEA
jgi:cyclopropane-fatty-acyl-phospholipid synthase